MLSRLLAALDASLGPSQAARELRWMRAAAPPDAQLADMLARRVRGEPLQYILGTQPFGPLNLLVRPPVLIPRPETEHWVLRLADSLAPTPAQPVSLLDLGTGSGCIPLLLCHLWPPGSIAAHAVDISPHALRLAQDNADLCGIHSRLSSHLKSPKNTFTITAANFLAPDFAETALRINPSYDIITSNPPYIPWKEYLQLPRSVIDFEDPKALFGGPSGFDFYHAIARLVSHKDILKPDALVALEVGHDQAATVENIMRDTGRFQRTEVWPDPWGKQRTVIARTR
ncbi:S-adenosyl-L-methionine-dependent methyltransferase [Pholiota conissans]|uniref:S-adenosyl-L-methionine-dependent methyltransferase n=1 Tax=Pholiota conissans TaxID=109636 RepID=A0A9P5Z8Y3_9AGAR|nr:S-adenosyl-L-methionine-dependent methyltransferase [Pholiota conissans]